MILKFSLCEFLVTSDVIHSEVPPWIVERDGLETSNQIAYSFYCKIKGMKKILFQSLFSKNVLLLLHVCDYSTCCDFFRFVLTFSDFCCFLRIFCKRKKCTYLKKIIFFKTFDFFYKFLKLLDFF